MKLGVVVMNKNIVGVIFGVLFSFSAFASGYEDCRHEGWSHSDCLNAGVGYQACRSDGWGHSDCLKVN